MFIRSAKGSPSAEVVGVVGVVGAVEVVVVVEGVTAFFSWVKGLSGGGDMVLGSSCFVGPGPGGTSGLTGLEKMVDYIS